MCTQLLYDKLFKCVDDIFFYSNAIFQQFLWKLVKNIYFNF